MSYIYISNRDAFMPADASQIQFCSSPVLSQPCPTQNIDYMLKQDCMCYNLYYRPLGLNTAYPGTLHPGFILCAESDREQMDGDVVKWTRTYCKVPASYSLPSQFAYNFIGFQGVTGINVAVTVDRPRFTQTVAARIQYDYFLLSQAGGKDTNGNPVYANIGDIPVIQEQFYYVNKDLVDRNVFTDQLTSSTFDSNPTVPDIETYLSWRRILNADGTVKQAGKEIVAQPSSVRLWNGNIVERQTVYIYPL